MNEGTANGRRDRRQGKRSAAEIAGKTIVQILFATGTSLTVDGLREKLRAFYRDEARAEIRAVAALSNVELITAILDCNRKLESVGLQLRVVNGVVSILTTRVESERVSEYVLSYNTAPISPELTTAAVEVLACVAFMQPISQAEIDRMFAADKRSIVVRLRDMGMVEEFSGGDGRLRFCTTEKFLRHFGLRDLDEFRSIAAGKGSTAQENN